jgi:hypothetical protein
VPEVIRVLRASALAVLVLASLSLTRPAVAAPDTNACIAAFDQGQRSKTAHHLRRAQTELLVCTQESCPSVLRADCAGVLRNVELALPTIVLAADDGEGHDITDVRVKSGNDTIAEKIDGRSLDFDPGTYDFVFERTGKPIADAPSTITVHQVLREGEKNRVVRATFRRKSAPIASAPGRVEAPPAERTLPGYLVPTGLGVLGLVGLGSALLNRLAFDSDVDEMRARCAPECTQSERADLSSTLVASNVSLGIGIGFLALAGASWFLLGPQGPLTRTTARSGRAGLYTW